MDKPFASRLIAWQRRYGRHDLPWQQSRDPYAIWLSEIMLQQTQVETVIPYYRRFLDRLPDIAALAAASEDAVLALWSGLGYYSRARHLHRAAKIIVQDFGGVFPREFDRIMCLPGIGRSTAAAIAAFAFGERRAILDGNVKRVVCRLFGVEGWPGEKAVEGRLWTLAEDLLPEREIDVYTQGLMDLGATLCRRSRPDCAACPFSDDCVAKREGRQGELPAARPRRALPERHTAMLLCLHAGEILLEKRPPSGIWGGLWSLPECPVEADPAACAHSLGLQVRPLSPLPRLTHTFSHFRLHIRPQPLQVARRPARMNEPGRLWLPLAEAREAALPTPVRKLIEQLETAGDASQTS
ncbi:A/G-specific DNA-adenine glycosylase [Sulfuritortus calidifontis]|uniref:Adenine DNA glycosylase n=1 Tax=Sulfuritortus calidifontis TaxID=1914471 RepID=A0A4R3JWH7_9PROT|nr:A/G-specific adenine glycosylase [Sulfuritortus calidifontis]TCS72600.1 A/G-specific DNA-adenine glycosylase [Sulfuritortus calidifontis]